MQRTLTPPADLFLDVHGVARRYNVKVATVWAWANKGRLPQPVRLTPGCSRWRLKDVEAWEEQRAAESGCNRREYEERQRRKRMQDQRAKS